MYVFDIHRAYSIKAGLIWSIIFQSTALKSEGNPEHKVAGRNDTPPG